MRVCVWGGVFVGCVMGCACVCVSGLFERGK